MGCHSTVKMLMVLMLLTVCFLMGLSNFFVIVLFIQGSQECSRLDLNAVFPT